MSLLLEALKQAAEAKKQQEKDAASAPSPQPSASNTATTSENAASAEVTKDAHAAKSETPAQPKQAPTENRAEATSLEFSLEPRDADEATANTDSNSPTADGNNSSDEAFAELDTADLDSFDAAMHEESHSASKDKAHIASQKSATADEFNKTQIPVLGDDEPEAEPELAAKISDTLPAAEESGLVIADDKAPKPTSAPAPKSSAPAEPKLSNDDIDALLEASSDAKPFKKRIISAGDDAQKGTLGSLRQIAEAQKTQKAAEQKSKEQIKPHKLTEFGDGGPRLAETVLTSNKLRKKHHRLMLVSVACGVIFLVVTGVLMGFQYYLEQEQALQRPITNLKNIQGVTAGQTPSHNSSITDTPENQTDSTLNSNNESVASTATTPAVLESANNTANAQLTQSANAKPVITVATEDMAIKPIDNGAQAPALTNILNKPVLSAQRAASGPTVEIRKTSVDTRLIDQLNKAYAALLDGNIKQAGLLYSMSLDIDSNNTDAMMGLAAIALKNADVATAQTYYRKILDLNPVHADARSALLMLSNASGQLTETEIKQAIDSNPDSATGFFALGNLYLNKQRWGDAVFMYQRALERDANNADVLYNLAVSLDHLGKPANALAHYKRAQRMAVSQGAQFDTQAIENRISELENWLSQTRL